MTPEPAQDHQIDTTLPPNKVPRRRKRDRIGFVAGLLTAGCIIIAVLGVAVASLFVSGVIPLTGLQHYVAADLQKRLGSGWVVSASKAAILRIDGVPVLQIKDAQFEHASGLRLRAPEADVKYDPWSILSGDVRVRSIDIHRVNLRLKVDAGGALTLETGDSTVAIPTAGPDVPQSVVEQAADILSGLLDDDSLMPGLDRFSLTESRLILAAPDGTERVGLENVSVRLSRASTGRSLRLSGNSPTGAKDILVSSRRLDDGEKRIDVSINAFRLDSFERLLMGPSSLLTDGFPMQGSMVLSGSAGVARRLTGSVVIGAGSVRSPDAGGPALKLDSITANFDSDASLSRAEVKDILIRSGQTSLRLEASLDRGLSQGWALSGSATGQLAGDGTDPVQTLTDARLRIEGNGLDRAELKSLTIAGPDMNLSASGRAVMTLDGPEVAIRLEARTSQARAVLATWPAMISPVIRALLVERVETGEIENLSLALDFNAAALRAARNGDPTPDDALRVDVSGKNVRFVIGEGIPKLDDVALTATGTGRTLSVQASAARLDVAPGRALVLSDGTFAIADTWSPRPTGRSSFRVTGGVDTLAALLALPPFRDVAPAQIDPDSIKGRIDLRTTVSLPLVDGIKASDVLVQAVGTMTGLASDDLLGDEKLENGTLAANYDRGVLSLRGDARLSGVPAQIDVRQDARGVGEAVVNTSLDQAQRQKRGLGFNNTVTGTLPIRIVKQLGRKPDAPLRFDLDLTRVAIDGLLPGWTKPSGRPGKLSFSISDPDVDGPDLNDIVLDASPVQVRGKLSLSSKGTLDSASFSQFRLSAGDDMRVEIKRDGAVNKVTVRGQVADMRPFLKPFTGSGPPARPSDQPPDLDLDLSIPILTGFNNEAVGNAVLKLSVRGKDVRQFDFAGRIGRAAVTVQQTRDGDGKRVRLAAEDGGAFLRFVDLYRRAYGGELNIDARPGADSVSGDIVFSGFRVRGEPALRRVLGEQLAPQGTDGTRAGRSREAGNDVAFTRLKGSFVRTPTRFELRDGVIWGNEIGISGQGSVDYARDRVDIAGTFVPGFGLNNAFAQVPILGPLLGGGQYEGLFAVNFRVAGSVNSPSMSINPLSAIAPGILRKFIDPLGGAVQGGNVAPRSMAP